MCSLLHFSAYVYLPMDRGVQKVMHTGLFLIAFIILVVCVCGGGGGGGGGVGIFSQARVSPSSANYNLLLALSPGSFQFNYLSSYPPHHGC